MTEGDDFGGPLYQQARQHIDEGRFLDALPLLAACARTAPHYKSYELLGECLLRDARPAEAVLPLAAACALNRGARPRVLLARALTQLGRVGEARAWLVEALQRHPGYGPALAAMKDVPG